MTILNNVSKNRTSAMVDLIYFVILIGINITSSTTLHNVVLLVEKLLSTDLASTVYLGEMG